MKNNTRTYSGIIHVLNYLLIHLCVLYIFKFFKNRFIHKVD